MGKEKELTFTEQVNKARREKGTSQIRHIIGNGGQCCMKVYVDRLSTHEGSQFGCMYDADEPIVYGMNGEIFKYDSMEDLLEIWEID